MANITLYPDPFQPNQRQCLNATTGAVLSNTLLAMNVGLIDQTGKRLLPFIVIIDDQAVMQAEWSNKVINDDMIINVVILPQGGDNLLGTVLALAVAVAAPWAAGAVIGATSLAGTAATFATLGLTAGFTVAGSLLIGALFTPEQPSLYSSNLSAASPTYKLQGRGNSARLGQPIPVIYGQHRIFPDLAATPWSHYENNEQYLHQLFMIGQGEYEISQIRIDDTPIAQFAEITYQIIPPDANITLFDPDYVNAIEVSGQRLFYNQPVGGFTVNPAHTRTSELQIDIVAPSGLFHQANDGNLGSTSVSWQVEYRSIDDDGIALANWVSLGNETLTADTNTAQRHTYIYSVPEGRYQLRLTRTTEDSDEIRLNNNIHWEAARARLSRDTNTTGVTLIAMRMRATNNLNRNNSLKVTCLAARKLPIWNGDHWSAPTTTRSIAWAIADIARADYGGKLDDARIDLSALQTLDTLWQQRSDVFDAVFDTNTTVWDALNRAARAGRAGCFMQGGILRIVRDQAQTIPVAMFSPRNIVKDSLKINYRLADDDTATAIKIQFHNGKSWLPDELTVSLDDDISNPANITLFGVIDEQQIRREGLYLARANRYRRKLVTFKTEMEGLIPTYGDLIKIIHQQPRWGMGGEIIGFDSQTNTLVLSETPQWDETTTGWLMLRSSNGGIQGVWQVNRGSMDNHVVLPNNASPSISLGGNREATHFGFASSQDEIGINARVMGVKPASVQNGQLEITALGEDPRVHLE